MSELVYLIGAGLNQPVTDWDGLKPPLANDFFQMALRHHKFADAHYHDRILLLYEYISRYWKKSKDILRNQPFNLEECFTMLQLQQTETERVGDRKKLTELVQIEFQLESFLAEYLSEFHVHALRSDLMREFGTVISIIGAFLLKQYYVVLPLLFLLVFLIMWYLIRVIGR